jgi:hypothetical protein
MQNNSHRINSVIWRHNTQPNDIQHKDTLQKGIICDIQHKWHSAQMKLSTNETQHDNTVIRLNVIMLSVAFHLLLCWMPLLWVLLRWLPLCWMPLCWMSLCWVSLYFVSLCWASWHYTECLYTECLHTECHYAECHYAECHYAECHYAECHYAECHYADCHRDVSHYAEWSGAQSLYNKFYVNPFVQFIYFWIRLKFNLIFSLWK